MMRKMPQQIIGSTNSQGECNGKDGLQQLPTPLLGVGGGRGSVLP